MSKPFNGKWDPCGCPLDTRLQIHIVNYSDRPHECMAGLPGEHTKHYVCDPAAYESLHKEPPDTVLGRWVRKRLQEQRLYCAQPPTLPGLPPPRCETPPEPLVQHFGGGSSAVSMLIPHFSPTGAGFEFTNSAAGNTPRTSRKLMLSGTPASSGRPWTASPTLSRFDQCTHSPASTLCTPWSSRSGRLIPNSPCAGAKQTILAGTVMSPCTPRSGRPMPCSPRSPDSPCSYKTCVVHKAPMKMPTKWKHVDWDKLARKPLQEGWRPWRPQERLVERRDGTLPFMTVEQYERNLSEFFVWLRVREPWRQKKLRTTAEAFILACDDGAEAKGMMFKVDRIFVTRSHEFHILVRDSWKLVGNFISKRLKIRDDQVGDIRRVVDIEMDAKAVFNCDHKVCRQRHKHGRAHQHGRPATARHIVRSLERSILKL